MNATIPIAWIARAAPLPVRAAVARGAAAHALARRLLALDDAALGRLAGMASPGSDLDVLALLLVIGDAEALPWVDGVVYLGRDSTAPDLLLPTALAPSVPAAVLGYAVRARLRGAAGPVAVVPGALIPCAAARAIDRARLGAWIESGTGTGTGTGTGVLP